MALAIGLPGLTPHEMRHTAASLAASAGANVNAVQQMLRYASAAITLDRYANLLEVDFDAVAIALDHAAPLANLDRVWAGFEGLRVESGRNQESLG